jgi:hypothetical protein
VKACKIIFYLSLLAFIGGPLHAQVSNEALYRNYTLNEADSSLLGFQFHNTNYFRNTEYFNETEEGRTLFGYHLHPQLFYQVGANVKLIGGVWLRYDFGGNQPFTQVLPTFTLKIQKDLEIGRFSTLFGTLEGGMSHRMLEPLYDINKAIIDPMEYGLQLKFENKKNWFDLWLDWQKFIEPGDFAKERLTGGVHYEYGGDGPFKAYYQGIVYHEAGQIDIDTITPFQILFNHALGLKAEIKSGEHWKYFGEASVMNFNDVTFSGLFPKKRGYGYLLQGGTAFKGNYFSLNYWRGENFVAPAGTSIYQSVSTVDSAFYKPTRQLVFLRLVNNFPVFNSPVLASLRFEPFLDLATKRLDYCGSLYLVIELNTIFRKRN